jgi:hypothetical protein
MKPNPIILGPGTAPWPLSQTFADRLIDQYLSGKATIEELTEEYIDGPAVMRQLIPALRAAARAPDDPWLAERCRALEFLFRDLRLATFAELESQGLCPLGENYFAREAEVLDLVSENGGHRLLETLPDRLQRLQPRTIKSRVERFAILAIGHDLRTARFPSRQFLPDGRVVDGLQEVRMALGRCDRFSLITFLFKPDPDLEDALPIDCLRAGRIEEVVTLACDRI